MNMNNKIFSSILVIALAVLLTVTVVFAWEEPNTAPPGGNVYAPLNTSINAQAKDGALVVGYGLSAGDDAFIVANGNVGIGMTNPGAKLDVDGQVRTNSIYVNAGEGLEIENGGSGYGPNDSRRINLRDGNPPTDGALVITSDVSSPSDAGNLIAYFDRNKAAFLGNVGIGMTNPNDKLEVSGNIRANRLTDRDNTNYYIDPNSTSRLSYIVSNGYDFTNERDLRSGGDGRLFRYNGQASMSFDDWLYMYDSNDGGLTNIKFNVDSEAVYAKAFYYSSDKNLKYNIEPLNGSLSKILELEPVAFNWKDDDKISIGLIAQDVEKIFPEVVSGEEGSKVVNYGILVAPLIEAVKEQQKEINELKAEIEALKLKTK